MKLQRQLSRRVGSVTYPKWIVVIPPEKIREVGWKEGIEINIQVKGKTII
jgi:hypothetical protein